MNAKLELMVKEQSEIPNSQEFLSAKYESLIELKKCSELNKNLRNEMASIVQKYSELISEVQQLRAKVNASDQLKLNNNVLIRGIDETEQVDQAVLKIASISEVQINENDIDFAKKLNYRNKQSAIMIKFNNEEKKNEFVKAAKIKKISTVMYGYGGEPLPIYVDPQLTRESFSLFKYAKKLKRVGIAFVWISVNGEILVRERPTSNIINVKTEVQIDEIERGIILRTNQANSNANDKSANSKQRADNGGAMALTTNAKRTYTHDRVNTSATLSRNVSRTIGVSSKHNKTTQNIGRNGTNTRALSADIGAVSLQPNANTSRSDTTTHTAISLPVSSTRTGAMQSSSEDKNMVIE